MGDNGFSFDDLLHFLDFAADKGHIKPNTAKAQKAACSQVLGGLDASEKADLRDLDIGSVFQRYTNLNPTRLSPDSLKTYRSRVEKAIGGFLSHRKDPGNWKPHIQQRSSAKKSDNKRSSLTVEHSTISSGSVTKTLTYPFPIRDDLTITISNIPRDFKIEEAKRLAAFLETLAFDFKAR